MKAKPMRLTRDDNGSSLYVPCEAAEATHIRLLFPGQFPEHSENRLIPVAQAGVAPPAGPTWDWNGDTERVTLSPSILARWTHGEARHQHVCHCFVRDGMIQYLNDCTHELAGQTVELLDVDHD